MFSIKLKLGWINNQPLGGACWQYYPLGSVLFIFSFPRKPMWRQSLDWWSHMYMMLCVFIQVWTHSSKRWRFLPTFINFGSVYDNFIHGETTKHSNSIFKLSSPTFLPNNIIRVGVMTPYPMGTKEKKERSVNVQGDFWAYWSDS